ncbi:hypothetical protein QYM36_000765 [Artemia franciscana]|uniref:Reverse transcriptase domain-containing protein n=1 Tax=Artemia franciscana TaxID=6661 RepID=A0AA88LGW5_ARTSF|nr:hypothetical protein QYM36_000765 [Artemia franciscana]
MLEWVMAMSRYGDLLILTSWRLDLSYSGKTLFEIAKSLHELETRSEVEDGREFMIESISAEEKVEKPYALIKLTENDSELAFKIDTGAEVNILPLKDFNKSARKPALLPTADVLTSYTGEQLKELDRLESLGVIEKVTKPTQCANSLVLVRKADGSLRICLDPVDLKRAIERLHYPISLFDEVAVKCKVAKKFFKMDARNGYWSMVLDKPSSELTTFNTMYGRYKWNRYPFGLISAQDEYQQKMEEVFTELDIGLTVDDIAGIGCSDAEHDAKLRTQTDNKWHHPRPRENPGVRKHARTPKPGATTDIIRNIQLLF